MACNPTYKGKRYDSLDEIKSDISYTDLSKLYHTSKASGERPEFVKSIEEIFSKTKDNEKAKTENTESKTEDAESPESKDAKNKKAKVLVDKLAEDKNIPGVYKTEAQSNPLQFLTELNNQMTGVHADGSKSARPDAEQAMRENMGNEIVDAVKEMFPDKEQTQDQIELHDLREGAESKKILDQKIEGRDKRKQIDVNGEKMRADIAEEKFKKRHTDLEKIINECL